jgi:energy-converting hydrogenase Eha subunit H
MNPMTNDLLRIFLLVDLIGMALMGILYLRSRRLIWWEWGLCSLVLLLPLLGPFLIITGQPGQPRQSARSSPTDRANRMRARRARSST